LATSVARKRQTRAPTVPPPSTLPARVPGKYERLCWERQARDLALAYPDGEVADPRASQHPKGYWFDPARAEEIVTWIQRYCRHSKGEWAGTLIVLEEWQKQILRIVFGWVRPDGTRRFRTAYEEVPRKNAKSTKVAAVGLYLMIGDQEPGAEVYSSATKEEQARIVWSAADAMVKQSADLRKAVRPRKKTLSCARLGSKFEPLGADSDTLDGLNVHGNLVDELHAHKDRGLWDVLVTAMGSRRQPLTWAITTAGVYDVTSVGWELHDHATQVLEGIVEDDAFFAIVFAADEGDDWQDPATWAKANPNLGISVKLSYMEEQFATAKTQPSFENTVKRLHLNIWTEQVTRWIPIEKWDACTDTPAPLVGRVAFGGLDLSTKLDITALTLLAFAADGFLDCFFRFWVPEQLVLEREQKHKLPSYAPWVKAGMLVTTPGNVIDYDFIRTDILKLAGQMTIKEIGYDPWNATQLAVQLQNELNPTVNEHGFRMVEMRQGMKSLSEPAKEFEKLIVDKKLRHGGHPVMRWMVGNASVRRDSNDNIVPDKEESKAKIDGVLSTINALGRAIVAPVIPSGLGAEFF
jgi:phage terminase large subunit-like protein